MLAGTGLRAVRTAQGSFTLEAANDGVLPAVTVSGNGIDPTQRQAVVGSDAIERGQASDLNEVFRQQPDVSVGGSSAVAEKVYVRGLEDPLLNITIDGASQSGRLYHHAGRLSIEPDLLQRVEVEAGAGAATAGPGALGGAIRFVTKDPDDLLADDQRFGGKVSSAYFTNGDGYKINLTGYGRITDAWSALLSVSQAEQDDVEDGNGDTMAGTASLQQMGFAKLVGELTDAQTLKVSYDYRIDDGERPRRPQWAGAASNPLYPLEIERATTTVNYQWAPANHDWLDLGVTLYNTDSQVTQDGAFGLYTGRSVSQGLNLQNRVKPGAHELTLGVDYRHDELTAGPANTDPDEQRDNNAVIGVYAQDNWQLNDAWQLSAGARYDAYDRTDHNDQRYQEAGFSPNAQVTWQATQALSSYVRYAEAFRGPLSPDAFVLDGGTNDPDLKAERASNREVGVEYATRQWFVAAKVYQSRIDNVIEEPGYTNHYENIGTLDTQGVLLSGGFELGRWSGQLGYHVNSAELEDEPLNAYDHPGVGNSIGNTLTASLDWLMNDAWQFGWELTWVQDLNDLETSAGDIDKPGYQVHDAYARFQPGWVDGLAFNLSVSNLFNEAYLDHATNASYQHFSGYDMVIGQLEPGRDIRLETSWRF
ncbi:hypothetical protein BGP77_01700 [Saccharospirillum sp. MSK14-1]|nr:hypothetical protein BGP77_01700 [Saccharospirillum sp. MSK14-1]